MQAYSDPSRASDPHALPDTEVYSANYADCPECGYTQEVDAARVNPCEDCGCDEACDPWPNPGFGYFWVACFPGCMPDSDPVGPFATEAEALADAQS